MMVLYRCVMWNCFLHWLFIVFTLLQLASMPEDFRTVLFEKKA